MLELSFTQEQKIKRFVSRFKFLNWDANLRRAVADCEFRDSGFSGSKNNDDLNAFEDAVGEGITRFTEKLLCRSCRAACCVETSTEDDTEFHFFWQKVRDRLFGRFHGMMLKVAEQEWKEQAAKAHAAGADATGTQIPPQDRRNGEQ
jgi:hypothetical protein